MTSTLRTVPATGAPEEPGMSTLAGPDAFNLTLAEMDWAGRGGGGGFSFNCCVCFGALPGEPCAAAPPSEALQPPEPAATLGWGVLGRSLIRLLRCSKSSWTPSCFAFAWAGVFLVGRSGVLGFSRGFFISGARTGCCLDRAT